MREAFRNLGWTTNNNLNPDLPQTHPFPAGTDPDRIVLNVTEDPSTSLAVTWRTCYSIQTGFAEIMEINGANPNQFSGTMYIISMSGSKMYKENEKPWMDKDGGHLQLYQLITVEGNTLSYKRYAASGDPYDSFKMVKQKGKKNKLVED